MKLVITGFLALVLVSLSPAAEARPGWRPPHNPGICTVTFKKCDFALNNICVKWNNKGYQVGYHQARWACYQAERQYGRIRDCYVNCQ